MKIFIISLIAYLLAFLIGYYGIWDYILYRRSKKKSLNRILKDAGIKKAKNKNIQHRFIERRSKF